MQQHPKSGHLWGGSKGLEEIYPLSLSEAPHHVARLEHWWCSRRPLQLVEPHATEIATAAAAAGASAVAAAAATPTLLSPDAPTETAAASAAATPPLLSPDAPTETASAAATWLF
ncbi:unnamed protein product [Closterium sp. NIES-54]